MKFHLRPSPLLTLPPNTNVGTRTLGISIWNGIYTRTQQRQHRTRTLTLHIHIPVSTTRIMYVRVDRIRGPQVGLAALR